MRTKRSVIMLVVMMSTAGALMAAATAKAPASHHATSQYASAHVIAIGSATTSVSSPDVHYDI
ncbi:hypothetical protein GCM10023322_47020 [Rugosimonospora acidiphila]|uniref:Uncharacterized protein n=1 Tax=Rugosimonospora acidiphila TaxID=556531 RepID=A0ABP9S3A0_9ACTN